MSADIIQFRPRPRPVQPAQGCMGEFYQGHLDAAGYPAYPGVPDTEASPDKARSGDPGTITTSEGDVFFVGDGDDCA